MKTGDPKQVIALSVAAVFAIGFLGKTLISSVGTESDVKPVSLETAAKASTEPKSAPKVTPAESKEVNRSSGTRVASTDRAPAETFLKRDSFSHPQVKSGSETAAANGKPGGQAGKKTSPKSSSGPGFKSEFSGGRTTPMIPGQGDTYVDPGFGTPGSFQLPETNENSKSNRTKDKEVAKPPKTVEVRYEGFVDAGNPIAVLRVEDKLFNVEQSDKLSNGILVTSISQEKIILAFGGKTRTVWLGRTVKI